MTTGEKDKLTRQIIDIGKLLWEKDLVSGLNGNISCRMDDGHILITATKTCLGFLKPEDMITVDLNGQVIGKGQASSETLLHTSIYRENSGIKTVLHTHTTYVNGYFLANREFEPRIFEAKFYLGHIEAIDQTTPSVTDPKPVVEALKRNNIVVLRNHGVVAAGDNLFDCFLLIQVLEDAVRVETVRRLFSHPPGQASSQVQATQASAAAAEDGKAGARRFELFSREQIDEIVRLVNEDPVLQDMGAKTQMTMELAVKLNETGQIYSFHFENGRIKDVDNNEDAEFLISAPQNIWRAVFNREIDPFVATTQKKMDLRGDFARISKWYAPCSRIFELWQKVPVK